MNRNVQSAVRRLERFLENTPVKLSKLSDRSNAIVIATVVFVKKGTRVTDIHVASHVKQKT